MVDDKVNVIKNGSIRQIFETMVYGDGIEDVSAAAEWLRGKNYKFFAYLHNPDEPPSGDPAELENANNQQILCHYYTPESFFVESILNKFGDGKNKWFEVPAIERADIIYTLGHEILKNQTLFSQIEIEARGILSRDTKIKSLPLLTDYLQYYSSFAVKHNLEDVNWIPEGLVVGIISDNHPLSSLGCILGPALAAGYKIVLQTAPRVTLAVSLLNDLAVKVGIPQGTIRIIPGDTELDVFFNNPKVAIISILDDILKEKFFIVNHFNKKLMHFSSSGTPMIIFENADLDSACQSAIEAAWSHQGTLPWSVKNILVQENVMQPFCEKLIQKINRLKIGAANKNNIDIPNPPSEILDELNKIREKAKNRGFTMLQSRSSKSFIPTVLIDGRIFTNNVIKAEAVNPTVTITAFRTLLEAVSLANNTRQGLAASIWTESTSAANEALRKLKVANVWINSHGLFAANLTVSPYKISGNAYFGGGEGFYEYVQIKELAKNSPQDFKNYEAMEKAIVEAKKAQDAWFNNLTKLERFKYLNEIAQTLNCQKKNITNVDLIWIDNWISSIYQYTTANFGGNFMLIKGYNVASFREAAGVIAIETLEDFHHHNINLIVAGLAEGNSVIVLNDAKSAAPLYNIISKGLPKGVLQILKLSEKTSQLAAQHKELNVYFGEAGGNAFKLMPLKCSNKFKTAGDDWTEVRNKVTLVKNVWYNVGDSLIF